MHRLSRTPPKRSPATPRLSFPQWTAKIPPSPLPSPSSEEEKLNAVFDRLPPLLEWKWSPLPTPTKPTPNITSLPSSSTATTSASAVEKKEEEEELLPVPAMRRRPRSRLQRTTASNPWIEMVIPTPLASSGLGAPAKCSLNCSETISDALWRSGVTSDTLSFDPTLPSDGDEETESEEEEEVESNRRCFCRKRQCPCRSGGSSNRRPWSWKREGRVGSRRLPEESVKVLRTWLEENMENPYASRHEKQRLAISSCLQLKQVQNWISNARVKLNIRKCKAKK